MAQGLDVGQNVSRVLTANGYGDAARECFWKRARLWRCARRLGQRQAGVRILAVCSGWGSAVGVQAFWALTLAVDGRSKVQLRDRLEAQRCARWGAERVWCSEGGHNCGEVVGGSEARGAGLDRRLNAFIYGTRRGT
jgi:hypothetical protein